MNDSVIVSGRETSAAELLEAAKHPVPVDRISELYRGEIFSDEDVRIARDRIHWMCAQCEGDSVLDVGCSQGIASILLAREGFAVTAIDVHPDSVAYARTELARETPAVQSRLSIVETDLATLAPGAAFDSILLGEVIEHQARPDRLLREAKSRLNPLGRMIVTTPFGLHPHPDHKVSLFPSDLVRFAREMGMAISRLQVDGSYMRCVYEMRSEPVLRYPELEDLLDCTQRATLEAEQRLHSLLGERDDQLKKRADAHKITQRKLAEATAALDEKTQAQKITQRKLAEAAAALEVQAHAQKVTQQRLEETATALEAQTRSSKGQKSVLEAAELRLRVADDQLAALRLAQQRLERKAEVREVRMQAMQRRLAAMSERNERIVGSTTHRVGNALVSAARSPSRALHLPMELWAIYRDARSRRAAKPGDAKARAEALPGATAEAPSGRSTTVAPPALPLAASRIPPFPALPSDLKQVKVAAVMDEFTFHSFAPECQLISLSPQNWEAELDGFAPDLVFIESAWRGAGEQWTQKVSNPSAEIMGVIAWCVRAGVPSVFWNKEDPVHFGSFQHIARAVDHVFTTDVDCIARYKRDLGHERVYLLPFAAQPALHNPIEHFERRDAFCFAGSYYLKYPERQRDFKSLMDVVSRLRPVEIFDRNYHKPHPHYEFPPEYEQYIVGSLPFDQIDKAYKGYRFGINMNTIKQSQTMFARRVFELLASNTIVVSNFSRGVRLLFGDLVVCSDAPAEIERRLMDLCSDEARLRKFRLAGVRKVMSGHTYAHRLAYVASKVSGTSAAPAPIQVTVIASAANETEAGRLLAMFRTQRHAARQLILVTRATIDAPGEPVEVLDPDLLQQLRDAVAGSAWVAPWSAADHYGPNYLTDLVIATHFSTAVALGKGAYYDGGSGAIELRHDGAQYRPILRLDARASMARGTWLAQRMPADAAALAELVLDEGEFLAIDEFNYCRGLADLDGAGVSSTVDDEPSWAQGASLDGDLLPLAERLPANASHGGSEGEAHVLPGKSASQLASLLPKVLPAGVSIRFVDELLEVGSQLAPGMHRYVYCSDTFSRAEWNLEVNSRFQLVMDEMASSIDLRAVFEFLDEDKRKIGHSISKAGVAQSMAIPARCRYVRFGLRLQGTSSARIRRLVLADVRERPSTLASTARHLLVAKQYPSYDDLYRYGFVHSRVRGYRRNGLVVDVFRLNADEPCAFREFEGVDVVQGDRDLLDLALRNGRYEHILVHLLDDQMWETLARHADGTKIIVWVHGAEIQTWQRRAFEFDGLDETEVARRKALSEQRAQFWRRLLDDPHPNLSLVFVSQYVADEAQRDLGIDLSRVPHQVIHNFIDGRLFAYRAKDAAQRSRVLSIRPFASRAYANDLAVRAVRLLSERPCFASLSFLIVGDGELFDETTRPLAGLANVTLRKGFLTQNEIATLHREYGVFLCPTRMDTQGVSRDEAMASGLVPVTMRVAAVPEFVDDTCGILVDAENAEQLADAIETLQHDPQRFLRMSRAAAARVRNDSGEEQTLARELDLLSGPVPAAHCAELASRASQNAC